MTQESFCVTVPRIFSRIVKGKRYFGTNPYSLYNGSTPRGRVVERIYGMIISVNYG